MSHASSRVRGGGNVGIAAQDLHVPMLSASDLQGLWEGRKTRTIVFRAFHRPPFPPPSIPVFSPTRSSAFAQRVSLWLVASAVPHRYRCWLRRPFSARSC